MGDLPQVDLVGVGLNATDTLIPPRLASDCAAETPMNFLSPN
jgi:hypothetical protein